MAGMTPRERVLAALDHREPDRVPIDLSSAVATGIHVRAYARLLQVLGIEEEIVIWDKGSQVARPSERVLELVGADVRGVVMSGRRPRSPGTPEDTIVDDWGTAWRIAPDGTCYTPTGFPLRGAALEQVESHPWPDGKDLLRVHAAAEEVRHLRQQTNFATIAMLSWIPLLRGQYLAGFDAFLEALMLQPKLAESILDHIQHFQMDLAASFLDRAGAYVDVVGLGDDFSTQKGPTISPRLWRNVFKPRLKEYLDLIRSKTKAKIWFHSCGSVHWVIRDLLDCGVDILNPVQPQAADMNTAQLKGEFGSDLSFWGAIDTQQVLPFGTPDAVEQEVRRRMRDLAPGGGYVLASCHNIEADVPGENVWAMFQAAQRYGKYPLARAEGNTGQP